MKLVECVPNFSEGRDLEKIKAITKEIEETPQVKLLDVDPGESTNRTVVTFIGTPEGVEEAAFKAIKKAAEVIDMSKHTGAHSRIGATDVCPFVPVSGVTMEDCVRIAHRVAERVARECGIPVYLYEEAAQKPERRNLANIRVGEYEGLEQKLKDPEWAPDYGEPVFNAKSGATVIGAREFLIAYNINLNTRDRRLAHEIALNLRERGRAKRDHEGKIIRDENGKAI
ncbi:MAG: glutamate formimidoyltransferase, partial [Candidatus Aminicenantales bacterium]